MKHNITQESIEKEQTKAIKELIKVYKQNVNEYQNRLDALKKRITIPKYLVKMQMLTYTNIPSIYINKLYPTKNDYSYFQMLVTERKNLKRHYVDLKFIAREGDVIEINPSDSSHKIQNFLIKDGKLYKIGRKDDYGQAFDVQQHFRGEQQIHDNIKFVEYKATLTKLTDKE